MSKIIKRRLLKSLAITLTVASISTGSLIKGVSATEGSYWKAVGSEWYYIDANGHCTTGWFMDNGRWYYCWSNGTMVKDTWLEAGGKWYYLGLSGAMATNTTIGEYRVGSDGAWIIDSRGPLNDDDINKHHILRGDIAQGSEDVQASLDLSSSNLYLNSENKTMIELLCMNLAQAKITQNEARSSCIGKSIEGRTITNITMFNEVFPTTTGSKAQLKEQAIEGGTLPAYKSNSSYVYDSYLVFSCGNERGKEWEAIRIVIEFENL